MFVCLTLFFLKFALQVITKWIDRVVIRATLKKDEPQSIFRDSAALINESRDRPYPWGTYHSKTNQSQIWG